MRKLINRCLLILISVMFSSYREPSGRGWDWNSQDIGLPSGGEVGYGILIAIITIPLGYLFLHLGDNNSDISIGGILGMILIGSGIICLIPLVAWLCSIASVIVGIGVALFVGIAIIVLIINMFNK